MEIDAAPGEGSRIVLTVPLREALPEEAVAVQDIIKRSAGPAAWRSAARSGVPIRVLLADDHAVVRDGSSQVLCQEEEIEVVRAGP
jgi:hypothetical protein